MQASASVIALSDCTYSTAALPTLCTCFAPATRVHEPVPVPFHSLRRGATSKCWTPCAAPLRWWSPSQPGPHQSATPCCCQRCTWADEMAMWQAQHKLTCDAVHMWVWVVWTQPQMHGHEACLRLLAEVLALLLVGSVAGCHGFIAASNSAFTSELRCVLVQSKLAAFAFLHAIQPLIASALRVLLCVCLCFLAFM